MKVPFERSYWIEPGKFLAGSYPAAQRVDELGRRLNALLDAGIRTVINLMEEYETEWKGYEYDPYEEVMQVLSEGRGFKVECRRIPMEDMEVPSHIVMKAVLDAIDTAIEQEKPVYVHCWGGRGRTGTVVGCWLARHGKAAGSEVLTMIRELRKNDPTRFQPSPETDRQREMVRAWKAGE